MNDPMQSRDENENDGEKKTLTLDKTTVLNLGPRVRSGLQTGLGLVKPTRTTHGGVFHGTLRI